ncbi:hypothetical protein TNCV_2922161, partial [Trichonephila clavipes]
QPPATACNRLQPPTTACTAYNRLHRLHRLHPLYSRIGFFTYLEAVEMLRCAPPPWSHTTRFHASNAVPDIINTIQWKHSEILAIEQSWYHFWQPCWQLGDGLNGSEVAMLKRPLVGICNEEETPSPQILHIHANFHSDRLNGVGVMRFHTYKHPVIYTGCPALK